LPDHVARAMPDEAAFIAMIRPLIEEWLADNLAGIVEDAVRDEIARITGLKPR
jgi:cell pole-organizing protein PopZ